MPSRRSFSRHNEMWPLAFIMAIFGTAGIIAGITANWDVARVGFFIYGVTTLALALALIHKGGPSNPEGTSR
jgi:uncharacterized membrane protein YfcA